jgi:hypothetical protein
MLETVKQALVDGFKGAVIHDLDIDHIEVRFCDDTGKEKLSADIHIGMMTIQTPSGEVYEFIMECRQDCHAWLSGPKHSLETTTLAQHKRYLEEQKKESRKLNSKPAPPEWLSEALNEGDGTYNP